MDRQVLEQIIVLFSYIAVGYIANKMGALDETANSRFSSFLLKVALPSTILNSAISQTSLERSSVIKVTLIALGIFVLVPILSTLIVKISNMDKTYNLMLTYSNLGFMGLPIILSVYGNEMVFYVVIFMMVFNVHIFTYGIITLQGKGGSAKELLKKLLTPGIISALIAYILVLFPMDFPAPVHGVVSGLGGITTPLAMLVIGSQLAEVRILDCLKNYKLYAMSAIKLVAFPIIIYSLLYLIFGRSEVIEIAAILFGLPVAGNVTMLCSEYDGDVSLAAQGTCISTIMSLITIPIMLTLIQTL